MTNSQSQQPDLEPSQPEPLDTTAVDELLKQSFSDRLLLGGNNDVLMEQIERLSERLTVIEANQTALLNRVDKWETQLRQDLRGAIVEVSSLRSDLLGDRKALSALGVFNGVVPMLDSLRALGATLVDQSESSFYRQVNSMQESLLMMLRGLGFIEFSVSEGEPFDPTTMECTEYGQGQQGIVLGITRTGFRAPNGVVRPVGVRLANH